MPLLGNGEYREPLLIGAATQEVNETTSRMLSPLKQRQHSITARLAMNHVSSPVSNGAKISDEGPPTERDVNDKAYISRSLETNPLVPATTRVKGTLPSQGAALTDTPISTASNSPTL